MWTVWTAYVGTRPTESAGTVDPSCFSSELVSVTDRSTCWSGTGRERFVPARAASQMDVNVLFSSVSIIKRVKNCEFSWYLEYLLQ